MLRSGLVYGLGFVVVLFLLTGALIRRFFPDSKPLSLTELRPYLVPMRWGLLIAGYFLLAQLLSGLWKPIEYALMPVPMIAIFVAIKKREEIRRILNSGRDDWLNN